MSLTFLNQWPGSGIKKSKPGRDSAGAKRLKQAKTI